jgi:uncharacterized protein (TIGR02996 family)
MTREDSFLHEILHSPGEDLPRRVYADWLMDQPDASSQARGEFIHLQLDLARLPSNEPRPSQLASREREILSSHAARWGEPFRRLGCHCWEYRRGLVEGVGLSAESFLANGAQLYQLAPIDELKLYDASGLLVDLAATRELSRVRTLDLEKNDLGDADLAALSASAHVAGVQSLLLWSNRVGDAGLRSVLAGFSGLTRLDLSNNLIGNPGAESLSFSPAFGRFKLLDFSGNQISDPGAIALASSAFAGSLGWIDLARNPIGTAGQAALRDKLAGKVHVSG